MSWVALLYWEEQCCRVLVSPSKTEVADLRIRICFFLPILLPKLLCDTEKKNSRHMKYEIPVLGKSLNT